MTEAATDQLTDQSEALPQDFRELCNAWLETKREENRAAKRRAAIEEALLEHVEVKDEGSKSTKQDGFKVTTDARVYRKLDQDAWERIAPKIPENLRPIKTKLEVDEKGVKWLQNNEPEVYALVAEAIEAKPGKTGVKVEPVEQ